MILLLLTALAFQAPPPVRATAADTLVTVRGLLVHVDDDDMWIVSLTRPFRYGNRTIGEVELSGNRNRWTGFRGQYVEARGRFANWAGAFYRGALQVEEVRPSDPEGVVRKTIGDSAAGVSVALWALPLRFAWLDPQGYPTSIAPMLVYSLRNHAADELVLSFPSSGFVCFTVEPQNGRGGPWEYRVFLDPMADQARIAVPRLVREIARLPRDGADAPGTYRVRASLCGLKDYEVETEIEVMR